MLFVVSVVVLKGTDPSSAPASLNWLQKKRLETEQDRAIKLLNMSMPPTAMYKNLMQFNTQGTGRIINDELIVYFEQMIEVMPTAAPAYSVLGFCYYYQGSKEKAYEFFQKAFLLDPKYFWSVHNFAMVALEIHRYDKAEMLLQMALDQDQRYAVEVLASSKIYHDILSADPSYNPFLALKENYLKDSKALALLRHKTASRLEDLQLHVKIF